MQYIRAKKPKHCVFCEAAAADPAEDEKRYVVYRGRAHFVVLNIWPYNNGHAMVVPLKHATDLEHLDDAETLEMLCLSKRLVSAYRRTMNAEGVNVGLNLGRISGGSIDHLHLHLVPRWTGDANFMPIIGNTKVLVERLSETWTRLHEDAATW
jgi:ATP adenylyltransferase